MIDWFVHHAPLIAMFIFVLFWLAVFISVYVLNTAKDFETFRTIPLKDELHD